MNIDMSHGQAFFNEDYMKYVHSSMHPFYEVTLQKLYTISVIGAFMSERL